MDRIVLSFVVILLVLCIPKCAQGADYAFKIGPGEHNGEFTGSIKIFELRREGHQIYAIHDALAVGFWVDNLGQGRDGSSFVKYQLGVKPGQEVGFYAKGFIGVMAISHTDVLLGGHFQFGQDYGIGIRDETSFVELGYSHISSAGIYNPNTGRDFSTLTTGVRF